MTQDLRARLRRLGVKKGARDLKPAKPKQRPFPPSTPHQNPPTENQQPVSITQLLPGGRLEETAVGQCMVWDKVYPLSTTYGDLTLSKLFDYSPKQAAIFCKDDRLAELDFRDFLFLDTETTGLGGAGTLAFMVGVAFFEGDALVVRQYFLRDHGDEAAMLTLLAALLDSKTGLVTFNGRTFDLPLLDTRYLMNRMFTDLLEQPHIDLLPPARRLWRLRFGSVALGALERNLLGLQRSQEDVEGWLIPGLYNHYLRSGDARELAGVFYHNRLDLISMVTLLAKTVRQFGHASPENHPADLLGLGKWQVALGMTAEAEANLRHAIAGDLSLTHYHHALHHLGLLLKRNGRRAEAVQLWQQWAATTFDAVEPFVEMAMYYEWHEKGESGETAVESLKKALTVTQQAINLITSLEANPKNNLQQDELTHRLARLQRKQQA